MTEIFDENVLYDIGYGMYIVTSHINDKLSGQIVNALIQVSAEPPRIAVCINKKNLTHEFVSKSGKFAVSVLDRETPLPFIGNFGFKSGRDTDKFFKVNFEMGATGCPIVTDHALSVMEANVVKQFDMDNYSLFVADVIVARRLRQGIPLTYAHYRDIKKGKVPKTAPTYHETGSSKEKDMFSPE